MKSRFGFVLALIVVAAVVGFAVLSSNSAASVQSSGQQSISAVCLSGQPAVQVTTDKGVHSNKGVHSKGDPNEGKKKCDPNEGKKKCDPNEGKKCDPNKPKK
jgi:hypothetical protein